MDRGLLDFEEEVAIIGRLKAGDRQAAAALYAAYGDRLYRAVLLPRLGHRETAEDILKDSFRIVLEKIETFEPSDRSIYYWIRRIAINRATDHHRKTKRQREHNQRHTASETTDRVMASPPPAPDRSQEMDETRGMVETSLSRLNPRYAQALRLRLIEDRDRADCAAEMGVAVGNFDVILHRACRAFKNVYPP